MTRRIVLGVSLGGIETFQRDHLSDYRTRKDLGSVQLRNIGLGDAFLVFAVIEDRRAVLSTGIGSLPV